MDGVYARFTIAESLWRTLRELGFKEPEFIEKDGGILINLLTPLSIDENESLNTIMWNMLTGGSRSSSSINSKPQPRLMVLKSTDRELTCTLEGLQAIMQEVIRQMRNGERHRSRSHFIYRLSESGLMRYDSVSEIEHVATRKNPLDFELL